MGRRKSKSVTVGYWYGLSLHMAICHGPVDAVTEVQTGERTAWSGSQTTSGDIGIHRPDLFGGEDREGGPDGTLTIMMGDAAQMPNAYLQGKLGAANVPAYRGVLSALWNGWVSAMNPYIKPWRFRVKRIPASWYPAKAEISGDANPAHIIRECLTNAEWGMGYPAADIDDASFTAAADALYTEGFGLSIVWDKAGRIEDFVQSVLEHVDGSLYVHPRTGLFTLKLTRADYNPATLPVLNRSNVLAIEEFSRRGWGELVNQVTLTYRDGPTDKDASITVHDIAAIEAQGGVSATTISMPGISRGDLAQRVAMRELRQLSANLAKLRLVANRQASGLSIGDAFKLDWPEYGITSAIFRVARIAYGTLDDGRVRIEAVEDVFGLPNAIYATPPPTGWASPVSAPAPCPQQALHEVPYYMVVADITGDLPSILNDIDATEGLVAALGSRPSQDAFGYTAWRWDTVRSAWIEDGSGDFAATGLLAADMPIGVNDITVTLTSHEGLDTVAAVDDFAIVDDEWFQVVAIAAGAGTVTLARGVLDTVPAAHAAGSRVWFWQPEYIDHEYVVGDTAQVRLTPRTGMGRLDIASAVTLSRAVQQRFIRPYPPGNVRIAGSHYPVAFACDLAIAWATRNRVIQTAPIATRQTEASVTPETGQTTTIRIYGGAALATLRRTYSGLAGTSQTWTQADMLADSAHLDGRIRVEIESSRSDAHGTFTSLYRHSITVDRAGFGLQYGNYYGGLTGVSCAGHSTSYTYGDSFVPDGGGPSSTTWNPADNSGMTLSNGNLTAEENAAAYAGVRATTGVASGKWYWEIVLDLLPNNSDVFLGVKTSTGSVLATGNNDARVRMNGQLFGSAVATVAGTWTACAQGDIIMLALDVDGGKLWAGRNGAWPGGGNPAAGTNPTFTLAAGNTWKPNYSSDNASGSLARVTARFSGGGWTYTPPTGYTNLP